MRKTGSVSKSTRWRRIKQAKRLGYSVSDLCDSRGKHTNHARGTRHGRWNSGRLQSSDGYTLVRVGVEHPLADANGYAYEHAIVWVSAGFLLPGSGEVIHHRSGDKSDNRLENLEMLTRAEHNSHHNKERKRSVLGQFTKKQMEMPHIVEEKCNA